ncbi:MAG: rubrerythrin [Planctomycetes bacterium]|nr:rubrerythrin [Planctomycetota bacterium]
MDLPDALEMVINDERALQEKYKNLAEEEKNPFVKEFFKRIVKDAINHEKKLHKKYEKILSALKKKTY